MPRGADPEREKEYENLKNEFQKEHRYPGREDEVAARIVNKQRSEFGETKSAREADRHGDSPDDGLPIENYDHLAVKEIAGKLDSLNKDELRKVKAYETKHHGRKTLLDDLERKLS